MINTHFSDKNASVKEFLMPDPLTLRELLRSWLDEAEPVEKAPKQKMEGGRRC